jgi:TolA-binding protein
MDAIGRLCRAPFGRIVWGVLCALAMGVVLEADIILSAQNLSAALKKMQRLQQEIASAPAAHKAEAVFQFGVEGDALASLLSDEVVAHGMQEKALIDLALTRARELGVAIAYNDEKRKFFYDGAAFERYVKETPRGPHLAEASFWMVENEFYRLGGSDPAQILVAVEHKRAFLRRHPAFALNAEVDLFLGIDFRDLYRLYADDTPKRDRYLTLARQQLRRVSTRYAGSEQAVVAAEMLRRLDQEVKQESER